VRSQLLTFSVSGKCVVKVPNTATIGKALEAAGWKIGDAADSNIDVSVFFVRVPLIRDRDRARVAENRFSSMLTPCFRWFDRSFSSSNPRVSARVPRAPFTQL
jgi:hypothetical protein